jgi:predicted nicotinamide N-methyase
MIERWIMHNSTDSINNKLEERDPFGVMVWPGSIVAAQEILNHLSSIENATVLVLGAGLGVEVQIASMVDGCPLLQ